METKQEIKLEDVFNDEKRQAIKEFIDKQEIKHMIPKELFLLRGLPGSGKSTLAKLLVGDKDYCHKEADMYFIDREGNYKFNPSQLKEAHKWCKNEIDFVMKYEHSPVVVSNTFTQEWEMDDYLELAKKYGYRTHSIIVENRHEGKNEHGVPEEKIEQMKNRFDIKL